MTIRGVTFTGQGSLCICQLCGKRGLVGWATDHQLYAHPPGDPSREFGYRPWPHPDSLTGVTIEGVKPTP